MASNQPHTKRDRGGQSAKTKDDAKPPVPVPSKGAAKERTSPEAGNGKK